MKNSSSKDYAKHCFNFEQTLVEKIGLDSYYMPVVSNGGKRWKSLTERLIWDSSIQTPAKTEIINPKNVMAKVAMSFT